MIETAVVLLSAAAGFVAKSVWQTYVDRSKSIDLSNRERRIANLEEQLEKFYWPLYLRLQRDNVVWSKILDRDAPDEDKRKTAYAIERSIILPNHEEIVKIIEQNIHRAKMDEALEVQLLQYLRHISVYQSLREAGIDDKDPLQLGEPWPKDLFGIIEQRTHALQAEYDRLLGANA